MLSRLSTWSCIYIEDSISRFPYNRKSENRYDVQRRFTRTILQKLEQVMPQLIKRGSAAVIFLFLFFFLFQSAKFLEKKLEQTPDFSLNHHKTNNDSRRQYIEYFEVI